MTTAATRAFEIYEIEGFGIEFLDKDGNSLPPHQNGLPSYQKEYERRSRGTWTVNEWKEKRFNNLYPGYTVNLLKEDGTIAAGQTHISTVRETYEGDE
ncbi:MAG: hypothetical protein WAO71_14995 [Gallionella sp.]